MINVLKKKLSLFLITLFVVFSVKNLLEFNDFGMLNVPDEDALLNILENDQGTLEYNEEEFFDQGLNKAKKFELTKKLQLTEDKSRFLIHLMWPIMEIKKIQWIFLLTKKI